MTSIGSSDEQNNDSDSCRRFQVLNKHIIDFDSDPFSNNNI